MMKVNSINATPFKIVMKTITARTDIATIDISDSLGYFVIKFDSLFHIRLPFSRIISVDTIITTGNGLFKFFYFILYFL